jgi:phenylalanyl-tRNA synthetase alpha chain
MSDVDDDRSAAEPAARLLEELEREAVGRVESATDLDALDAVVPEIVGRRSAVARLKRSLAGLPPDERRGLGLAINGVVQRLEALVSLRRGELAEIARRARVELDRLDLTECRPGSRPRQLHLVTPVREAHADGVVGMGYEVADGPEAETEWYNFTALNVPRDHPARSSQDSFYLATGDHESYLLRTQTSPVQIRLLERGILPLYAVAPGRVYRRDTADARHLPAFHQIEGIVVDRGVTFGDMAGTIETFVHAIFGAGIASRLRPAYFPFTEPSAEFEVTCSICRGSGCKTCSQTGWIELGGCGMIHPAVLEATAVDPEQWSGFAFGFGIDRLAMMRHEIDDIRSLTENDVRFLTQF